jgi:uroporphyrinogen decarboxylase
MTHRERIRAAIERKPLDRIPTDFWGTVEVQERLFEHFGIDENRGGKSRWIGTNGGYLSRGIEGIIRLWDTLGVDGIFDVHPPYIGPPIEAPPGITMNEWGFGYRDKPYGIGVYTEQVVYPLADAETPADIDAFRWPDPDWYDYSALPDLIGSCGDRAVNVGYSAVFTFHNYLRGLERSLIDPVLNPELAQRIIERLSDFFTEYHTRCFEAASQSIDVHQVTDDWGSQTGLLVSPQLFREFYREPMQRAIDLAKRYGIFVFHHDDGDCRALIPEFVEMGIDLLNPIQYRCGNWDLAALKRDHGGRICFHSAVDNQELLPLGSPEEVRREVRMLIDTLASDRTGFILGPCHNLQPVTPTENIIAMYDEASSYGDFSTR